MTTPTSHESPTPTLGALRADRLVDALRALGREAEAFRQHNRWNAVGVGRLQQNPSAQWMHVVSFEDDGTLTPFISGGRGNPWRGGPEHNAVEEAAVWTPEPVTVEGLTESADGALHVHDPRIKMPLRPEWGLRDVIPPNAPIAWGARAIYAYDSRANAQNLTKRGTRRKRPVADAFTIDLLWDRQGIAWDASGGASEADLKLFSEWLNTNALPELRKRCNAEFITTDCDAVVEIEESREHGTYFLKASPLESHGYMYISAWLMLKERG